MAVAVALLGGCAPRDDMPARADAGATPAPLVIAHRGASGYRPEHTLAAYALAVAMGADFIEPDLVRTADGALVARHEPEIGGTTDVAQRFPGRRRRAVIDGDTVDGWFASDFTLAELRTLRARERLPFRTTAWDGVYGVPTLDEVLALADSLGRLRGRPVGVYPELKHPTWHRAAGLPMEEVLLAGLRRHGLDRADAPVFIQSFEEAPLRELSARTPVPLVLLLAAGALPPDVTAAGDGRGLSAYLSPDGLRRIATFARGIGVETALLLEGEAGTATSLLRDAHAAGLLVHAWTLRAEPRFLAPRHRGELAAAARELTALGVDGVFTDHPDLVVRAVRVPEGRR